MLMVQGLFPLSWYCSNQFQQSMINNKDPGFRTLLFWHPQIQILVETKIMALGRSARNFEGGIKFILIIPHQS